MDRVLRVGIGDLRFIHAPGVCLPQRRGAGGLMETVLVAESEDLARDARLGRDWVRRSRSTGACEALVLLERSEAVRRRLVDSLRSGVLKAEAPSRST